MKVLLVSSAGIYDSRFPETKKNNSGFGHMIRAIATMLCDEGHNVDILTQSNVTHGRQIGKARLIKKTYFDLLAHVKPQYLRIALRVIKSENLTLGMKARTIMYFMNGSFCEDIMKRERYDVVHINGIGVRAIPFLMACERTDTPFAITLHGLVSFDESVVLDSCSKEIEKGFLRIVQRNNNVKMSVVSTGIKRRIENYCGEDSLDNIEVICNPIVKKE